MLCDSMLQKCSTYAMPLFPHNSLRFGASHKHPSMQCFISCTLQATSRGATVGIHFQLLTPLASTTGTPPRALGLATSQTTLGERGKTDIGKADLKPRQLKKTERLSYFWGIWIRTFEKRSFFKYDGIRGLARGYCLLRKIRMRATLIMVALLLIAKKLF